MNTTVREIILFGVEFDTERYNIAGAEGGGYPVWGGI